MIKTLLYEQEVITQLREDLRQAKEFGIASALVSSAGVAAILGALQKCLAHGGKGRILVGIHLSTDPEALKTLLSVAQAHPGKLQLKYFLPLKTRIFHPKLYMFRDRLGKTSAIVGSSNFTGGGFNSNYEANLWICENAATNRLREYFDEHFEGAYSKQVTSDWINSYREDWLRRRKEIDRLQKLPLGSYASQRVNIGEVYPPKRIDGQRIAFTGRIADLPRHSKLYPLVRRLGGYIVEAEGIAKANCLVHAEIMGGHNTIKLKEARKSGVPVITEKDFWRLAYKTNARRVRNGLKPVPLPRAAIAMV